MTRGMLHIGEDVQRSSRRMRQFLALTKPRVVSLIVFTAVIGMFLATGHGGAAAASFRRRRHRARGRGCGRHQLVARPEDVRNLS